MNPAGWIFILLADDRACVQNIAFLKPE